MRRPRADGPAYDYLLVAGPGRSGSTLLYQILRDDPAFRAPEIKEGHYYRSPRRFERAIRRLRPSRAILLDAANTAWTDPRLDRILELRRRGHRILLTLLLRPHRPRAVSVMEYHESRGLGAAWRGPGALERAALADSLTAPALARLFALGADVLVIGFEALVGDPRGVQRILVRLCGTPAAPKAPGPARPVNPSVRATHPSLAAAGKLTAVALRAAGARRALQALKDNRAVTRIFFRRRPPSERLALSRKAGSVLDHRERECLAAIAAECDRIGDGLWFRPAR